MGVPKQEEFILKAKQVLPNSLFVGVGGSFDVWSGVVERAPEIYQLSQKGCSAQGAARLPYYTEICNIITDEAYMVPLYNGITTIAYNANLNGVGAHCLNYYLFRYWNWK